MPPQEFSALPYSTLPGNGDVPLWAARRTRERWWLHVLLFAATLFTTTVVGSGMAYDFRRNLPYDLEHGVTWLSRLWANPLQLAEGLPFSLTLMAILLAHECGHYLACRHYGVDASPPYFLPAPTLLGTFGAFIRIRSAIYTRRVLFDVGVAGPLAGFVFLLPALAVGLAFSKIIPGVAQQSSIQFGTPALEWLMQQAILPGVASADIYPHPIARAAWIGMLATALNLLPIGQLDGGHIIYSLARDRHRLISKLVILSLVPLGIFCWWVWLLWAVVLFFLGRRHPVIYDSSDLGPGRRKLGWLAMLILLLCFTPTPAVLGG